MKGRSFAGLGTSFPEQDACVTEGAGLVQDRTQEHLGTSDLMIARTRQRLLTLDGMPIGGVVAYAGYISPSGAGYDIGCGNKAVLLDANAADVRANIKTIMKRIGNMRVLSY